MTDRERAIVMAYTGVAMLTGEKIKVFYDYVEEILNRPVSTLTLAFSADLIKEKSRKDFISLCSESHD